MNEYIKFRSAFQSFARQFDAKGSVHTPCGASISPTKAHIIMEIGNSNDGVYSLKVLAVSLGLNKSNITRLIQSLEKSGFVSKVVSKSDKRIYLLKLTTKGKKICKKIEASSQIYIEELLSKIPSEKHKNIIETLEILNKANSLLKDK